VVNGTAGQLPLNINDRLFPAKVLADLFPPSREWHLLSAILNEQPPKILHRTQMRRRKCLCIKQYAEEQYVWLKTSDTP
jgi:hypothetical protein